MWIGIRSVVDFEFPRERCGNMALCFSKWEVTYKRGGGEGLMEMRGEERRDDVGDWEGCRFSSVLFDLVIFFSNWWFNYSWAQFVIYD